MARVLTNMKLFVPGDPESSDPEKAFITYDVVDGVAKKQNQIFYIEDPTWSNSANQFASDAVGALKTAEGVS